MTRMNSSEKDICICQVIGKNYPYYFVRKEEEKEEII